MQAYGINETTWRAGCIKHMDVHVLNSSILRQR